MFQPGKTMDMPTSSWTNDPGIGALYAKGDNPGGEGEGAPACGSGGEGHGHIGRVAVAWQYRRPRAGGEAEVVTGGRFKCSR